MEQNQIIGYRIKYILVICGLGILVGAYLSTVWTNQSTSSISRSKTTTNPGRETHRVVHQEKILEIIKVRFITRNNGSESSIKIKRSIPGQNKQITPRIARTRNKSIPRICRFSGKFNINKLARAVARFETGDCTIGNSAAVNNCFGIRAWENGKPYFKRFKTPADSYKDFNRIWGNYYKGFPTLEKAKRWTGNDRKEAWLCGVKKFYNQTR